MLISRRAQGIQASPIRKLKPLADDAKREEFIFSILTLAARYTHSPAVIEAFRAYHDPILGYGPSQGFIELRQAIADYFRDYGIKLTADNVLIAIRWVRKPFNIFQ